MALCFGSGAACGGMMENRVGGEARGGEGVTEGALGLSLAGDVGCCFYGVGIFLVRRLAIVE